MKRWHGYPIDDDCHSEFPWWQCVYSDLEAGVYQWARRDGEVLRMRIYVSKSAQIAAEIRDRLAAHDREHPMPVPAPLAGQVWLHLASDEPRGITRVTDTGDAWEVMYGGRSHTYAKQPLQPIPPWPPSDHVLVWGPDAPWAPPEPEPEIDE